MKQKRSPHHLSQLEVFDRSTPWFSEVYHFLMVKPWWMISLLCLAGYLGLNVLFSVLYWFDRFSILNADPNKFSDCFFFSVQTLSTLGYGNLAPKSFYVNSLVTVEAFMGLMGFALSSGLAFAKFSKPTAKVVFSRFALISEHDGEKVLTFRMANARASQIIDATLQVVLVFSEKTAEGTFWRKLYDIKLERNRSPVFQLTWTAFHRITPDSPLFGKSLEDLRKKQIQLFLTLVGLEASFSQTVHARHQYTMQDLVSDHVFSDILALGENNEVKINYQRFHEIVPLVKKPKDPSAFS